MIQAIVFDFDGLILNTELADFLAWQAIFEPHQIEFPLKLWHQNVGTKNSFDPVLYLQARLGRVLNRGSIMEEYHQHHLNLIRHMTIMPGVEERIAEARLLGLKVAVASSSQASWLNLHLPRLGLHKSFDVVRTCTDVEDKKKPDPAVYLSACQAIGVNPTQAIAFEDSRNGVLAAKAAGMFCVAVPNEVTQEMDFSAADFQIPSLAHHTLTHLMSLLTTKN